MILFCTENMIVNEYIAVSQTQRQRSVMRCRITEYCAGTADETPYFAAERMKKMFYRDNKLSKLEFPTGGEGVIAASVIY